MDDSIISNPTYESHYLPEDDGLDGDVPTPSTTAANSLPDKDDGLDGDVPTPSTTAAISLPDKDDGLDGDVPTPSTTAARSLPDINHDSLTIEDGKDATNIDTMFFPEDPSLRIDYVITYVDTEDAKKEQKRVIFQKNLEEEGLSIDIRDKSQSVEGETYYMLINGSWESLITAASLMNMKKRLRMPKDIEESPPCCECHSAFAVSENIIPEEDDYFTATFSSNSLEMFEIDMDRKELFFTNSERSLILKNILDRTAFTPKNAQEIRFGITKLINDGVYSSAYPIHEGPHTTKGTGPDRFKGRDKDRKRLYEGWARPGRWYCYQPLDLIRKYFGEKIAIYFCWLGFYTTMLVPAAIVGVLAFIYGCATLFDDIPSEDICNANTTIMCPVCDKESCHLWKLKDSCIYSRLTYLFDNYATVAFAAFMAIWSTMFLEFWKRKQNENEFEWDVADFELEERMRPEFEFKVTKKKVNPITQAQEPYMTSMSKCLRGLTAYSVVLFMIFLVLGAIFGVIIYRMIVVVLFASIDDTTVSTNAKLLTTITAACINLVVIMILNQIYRRLAEKLTELEIHRTDTEYEDSFTFKMFLFQFVNFYGTIFYIAFFKGRFIGRHGTKDYWLFGKYELDGCDPSGCLIDLCIQLAIIMVGKQAINNAKEIILPWLIKNMKARSSKKKATEDNLYMRWEQDEDLAELPKLGLFEEYLEMVVQFGFVTIFVAAFPLAPLFALLNNIIEIRLDAWKFTTLWRRPPATKAQDLGVWFSILEGLAFMAVLSNAFIIAFTSDFIPKLVYIYIYQVDDDGTLHGYINDSLAYYTTDNFAGDVDKEEKWQNRVNYARDTDLIDTNIDRCRYKDYRDANLDLTMQYWHVLAAKLAFVICFEHACFFLTWLVSHMIPDVSGKVKRLKLFEKQLTKKLNFDATFAAMKDKKNQ